MWTLNTIGVQASKLLQLMFIIHYYEEWLHLTMECEDEVSETMALFWTNFNEALQKVSGVPNLMFNPIGWMADEAGANWAGLREVFGSSVISRTISCQFHYMQGVNNHAQKLSSVTN